MNDDGARYRGWLRPGPVPPGGDAPHAGETLDFLCGHWRIFQLERGHKYSVDDVLTAHFAVTCAPRVTRHLDLGSGIGSVALLCAWRLPGTRVVTVEAQDASRALQERSVRFNGVADRFTLLAGDLRTTDTTAHGPFDLVTGTPPYWPVGAALAAQHPQAVPARLETRGTLLDYAHAARAALAPGGVFVTVHQGSQHARALEMIAAAGLVAVRVLPVLFKEGAPVHESGIHLYACHRKEDVPTTLHAPFMEPPLTIRDAAGHVTAQYAALRVSFGFPPGNVAAHGA
jgi:tRNA1Val (adenine37-N6)-methyltransferase